MSSIDLLGYNFRVSNLPQMKRVLQVIVSLIILVLVLAAGNWAPLDRYLNQANQANESGDLSKAALYLAQAAKYSPNPSALLEQAGINAFKAGDLKTGKEYLNQVQEAGLLSAAGYILLGDIAQQENNTLSSIQYWEKATNFTRDTEIYMKLIRAYLQIDDWENAIQAQRDLVTLVPGNSEYNYRLGIMLAASQPEAALAYLTLASELSPTLNSDLKSPIRKLRTALNSDEKSYPLVVAGQILASFGEWELASRALTNAIAVNPNNSDAWAYLGEALQQIGDDGLPPIEKALEMDPESIAGNMLLALYWQRQERYDLALVYLYAASQLDENNPAIQAEIGNTLGLMGNIAAAESHYLRATEISPKDPTYLHTLANYYIRYEIDLRDKGASAARRAVILAPEDPEGLDILAQIYLLLDNPILARRFLTRALAVDDKYAPAHLHFGLVSITENDPLGAYQHFRAAISYSAPDSPVAQQARRLLETHFP
jgi:tetratricopeptide (TPR) repeat protein